MREPPHYLQTLKSTTTPKRLLWLACHGNVIRKREHHELRFQIGALGRTWYTSRTGERRDRMETFDSPADLWASVAEWCPQSRRTVLFAWDLAEQMRLSQLLTHLPAMGWSLDRIVLERAAAWCLLRNERRTLLCCDLQSWTPVPWEKLARDVIDPNTEPAPPQHGPGLRAEQCERRASIIRGAVLQILGWIEGENLGPFRPTGSGQSYAAYRRRFIGQRLLVHDDLPRLDAERRAMHTGRAEAWKHGRLPAGRYEEFDLHAAYATIGRDCDVPTFARGDFHNPQLRRVEKWLGRYAVLADVTVTTDVECVPYRVNDRTLWPVGTFRTQIWDPELRLALQHASKITFHRVWLYDRGPAIADFCAWVLDSLGGQTQIYGLVPQRVLKHWSRCLVGRLGLRFRAWHEFGPLDPPDVALVSYYDWDDDTRTDMLYAGNRCLLLGELTESTESLPQVPGWVMSECRARLWHEMRTIGERDLVYVDTDSVITRGTRDWIQDGQYTDRFGTEWRRKGVYERMVIYGPRNLQLNHSRRVAGLPLSAEQTRPLEFTGEVMRGVKHAMRNGELDCVVSLPRTFHLSAQDLRRGHKSDGSTFPFEIRETTQTEDD